MTTWEWRNLHGKKLHNFRDWLNNIFSLYQGPSPDSTAAETWSWTSTLATVQVKNELSYTALPLHTYIP